MHMNFELKFNWTHAALNLIIGMNSTRAVGRSAGRRRQDDEECVMNYAHTRAPDNSDIPAARTTHKYNCVGYIGASWTLPCPSHTVELDKET